MSAIQSATFADPQMKPKKVSSRPKSHNDILLKIDAAEPEETQKRICVLKLTYHVGEAHHKSKSPRHDKTELFSWKPTKGIYEIQHGDLKTDSSKFAMPDLDKPLYNRIVGESSPLLTFFSGLATNTKAQQTKPASRATFL